MLLRGPYDIIHYARFSREKWQVPGGFIERESRFEQCLKREVGAKKKKKNTEQCTTIVVRVRRFQVVRTIFGMKLPGILEELRAT